MFRNYHAYSTAAKWGVYLYVIALLISVYAYSRQLQWVSIFYDTQDALESDNFKILIAKSNTLVNTMNTLEYSALLLSAILILVWIYQSSKNLATANKAMQYSPGWTIVSCFIPFYNFIHPYKAMREIVAKSGEHLNGSSSQPYFFVGIWWGLWLLSVAVSALANRRLRLVEDVDDLLLATKTVLYALTTEVVLCAAVLYLIHRVYNMQLADPVLNRIIDGTPQQRTRRPAPRA